jgi:hypothetical protein
MLSWRFLNLTYNLVLCLPKILKYYNWHILETSLELKLFKNTQTENSNEIWGDEKLDIHLSITKVGPKKTSILEGKSIKP